MEEGNEEEIITEEEESGGDQALQSLRQKLKKCVTEKQEYMEGWQRMRADFANEKRDSAVRLSAAQEYAFADAAEKIIPLIDAFDLAMSAPGWGVVDAAWRTGVEGLRSQALQALKELGVEPYSPLGDPFDPYSMSASREVEGGESHTVIAVDRIGFKQKEKILRPAFVAIAK